MTVTAETGDGRMSEAAVQRILEERARKVAVPEDVGEGNAYVEVLRFQLAYQEYAIGMRSVREVVLTGEITPVPGAPPFIAGICASRGQIISLVDLRVLFSLPEKGLTELNRVIVLTNGKITFGILADTITGIGSIPAALIHPPEQNVVPTGMRYVTGCTSDSLVVLDAASLLGDPSLIVDDP